jgi:hypothetical protein
MLLFLLRFSNSRTFYFPTTEYVMNETVKSTYQCCDGWRRNGNEPGCTLSESLLPVLFFYRFMGEAGA